MIAGDLADVGRRFAAQLALSEFETAGLVTALAVYEAGASLGDDVQAILGGGNGTNGNGHNGGGKYDVRRQAVEALLYGSESWDGSGYPEGRRGARIPRVARAFAVCREYGRGGHEALERLRGESARALDPRMVQRFVAMLRGDSDSARTPAA